MYEKGILMRVKHGWTFQVGIIGALSLLSSVALADTAATTQLSAMAEEFAKAKVSLSVEDMMDGLVVMKKLAVQNYAPAQAVIGEFLDGSEEDVEAVGWFMLAANQGDTAGEFGLGSMYLKGEGVAKDPEKALHWIKRAFEKDYPNAVSVMARAYRVGPGISGLPLAIDLKMADSLDEKVKLRGEEAAKAVGELMKANRKRAEEESKKLQEENEARAKAAEKGK